VTGCFRVSSNSSKDKPKNAEAAPEEDKTGVSSKDPLAETKPQPSESAQPLKKMRLLRVMQEGVAQVKKMHRRTASMAMTRMQSLPGSCKNKSMKRQGGPSSKRSRGR